MDTHKIDTYSPPETLQLIGHAGVAKAKLPWIDLILKSFLGGVFIALGGVFDLVIAGGSPGLRDNNPAIATLIAAFTFPIGFVLVLLTNVELVTSNFFTMTYSMLLRHTTLYDLDRNWVVCYVFNLAGALFFAGVLTWWSDTLSTGTQSTYAAEGAEGRVNINWAYNFTRGLGCNWLVGLALFLCTSGRDLTSKIYGIWIPIWAFVALGYQHSIANFLLVPVGLFYGADVSVGKFIWASVIPVTLGNIVGGALFCGVAFWLLYGREPALANEAGHQLGGDKRHNRGMHGEESTMINGDSSHNGSRTANGRATNMEKSTKLDDAASIKDSETANLLASYGAFPLSNTGLEQPETPRPDTILTHVFHALLVSTRISHQIADKTLKEVIRAGYADLPTLEKSSWEERTEVLTKGGYTHYREKTATELGGLAEFVRESYDGDLNNLLKDAKQRSKHEEPNAIRTAVRAGLQEIKGISGVALDVFCDTVQSVWHELTPFLDPRSQQTAKDIGLSVQIEAPYHAVNKDPVSMSRLAAALTTVRLEGLRDEFA